MQTANPFGLPLGAPFRSAFMIVLTLVPFAIGAAAQTTQEATGAEVFASTPIVPQQVRYAGKLPTRSGDTVEAVFRIYSAQEGGDPLWTETQHIAIGEDGSYTVLLGSATPSGLPQTVFAGGAARWLGVSVERGPEAERTLLSSVPYAMKSADAESLAGHPARDFVTQEQLLALQPAQPTTAPQPETGGTVTGSGTTNTVPLWTSSSAIGNSVITQSGKAIGIGIATPASTLDVDGGVTVRGDLNLPAPAKATASKGQPSNLFEFSSSAWNSSSSAAQGETFFMVADPTGNDTASPSATLNFQFKNGSAAPATVFSVAGNGIMTFSPAQTFPGTISSITGTSPITAITNTGAATISLNTTALETTLNSVYAQLATGNNFQGFVTGHNSGDPDSAGILGVGTSQSIGTFGESDTGFGVDGTSTAPAAGYSGVMGSIGGPGVYSNTYSQIGTSGSVVAGVWGDTAANPIAGNVSYGLVGTADNNVAAGFYNNSSTYDTVYVNAMGSSSAIDAFATSGNAFNASSDSGVGVSAVSFGSAAVHAAAQSGYGVQATSSTGEGVYGESLGNGPAASGSNGVQGYAVTPKTGYAGVFGNVYAASNTYNAYSVEGFTAGVWADAADANDGSSNIPVGILGTADSDPAGFFINNSSLDPTIRAINLNTNGVTGLFTTLKASTPRGVCGIGDGDLSCTGQMKSLVTTTGGAHTVETYATQSAENWMEDYGTGTMERGVALVKIDPTFAETVSMTADYHVFLTPRADSKGLYVINATPTSFEVRESGGGTSSLIFDYKIVAKRRGYEAQRLVDVTERFRAEQSHSLVARGKADPNAHSQPRQYPVPAMHPHLNQPLTPGSQQRTSPPPNRVRPSPTNAGSIFGSGVASATRP